MTYAKKTLAIGALALAALSGTVIPAMADSHMPAPPSAAAALKGHTPAAATKMQTPVPPLDRHRPVTADDSHHPIAAGDHHIPVAPLDGHSS
ncbi:hypothetical protein [Streptomyces sp. NPDC055299]